MSQRTVDCSIYGVTPHLHVRHCRQGVERIVVRELPRQQAHRQAPAIDAAVIVVFVIVNFDDVVVVDNGDDCQLAGAEGVVARPGEQWGQLRDENERLALVIVAVDVVR